MPLNNDRDYSNLLQTPESLAGGASCDQPIVTRAEIVAAQLIIIAYDEERARGTRLDESEVETAREAYKLVTRYPMDDTRIAREASDCALRLRMAGDETLAMVVAAGTIKNLRRGAEITRTDAKNVLAALSKLAWGPKDAE